MFPKIFCLHSTNAAPTAFKSVDDIKWKKDSERSYICKLKCVEGETVDQLIIFTDGVWPVLYSDLDIDIYLNGDSNKLCSLTKSKRCFLWTKDESKEGYELLTTDDNQITLSASFPKTYTTTLTEEVQFSTPVLSDLSEGEIMRKENETTPEVNIMSPSKTKTQIKDEQLEKGDSPLGPVSKTRKQPKKVEAEKATLSSKSKKRQLEKENLSSVTPKLKAARCRGGSRVFGHEKTPPSKRVLVSKKTSNDSVPTDAKSKTVTCIQLSSRVPTPTSRWGHSMCMVDDKKAVLIGGQGNKMQLCKDSVWTLDTECRAWKAINIKAEGMKPECRTGHSATYDPTMRCIYVFGGSKNSRWFHDVHMYDLDEQKWALVKANGKAPTRAYHSATLYRHELWMFGGVFPRPDPQPDGCDNELHIFSPVMEGWYKPIVTGEKPLPRSGHSANLVEDRLIVFGGWDFPFCYSDLHILDLTTVDWSTPKIEGESPKPRCWAASSTLTNNRVFLHGGYDGDNPLDDAFILDLDTLNWQKLVMNMGPSARAGHACIRLCSTYESQDEDEIIIFGGGDNDDNFFSDMLSFYVPYKPAISY